MSKLDNVTILSNEEKVAPTFLKVRSRIDHTLLDPAATEDQILKLCDEAVEYGFASVCVAPCWISTCHRRLSRSDVRVCTVIGFPHGNETTEGKVFAARDAVMAGADEVDMVINVGWVRQRCTALLEKELKRMVAACGRHVILKVIIECCLLTDEEKVYISKLCADAGVDFVKTSTGFSTGGAKLEDIKLIRDTVGNRCSIKAAGGIRTLEAARAFAEASCERIGCSRSVALAQQEIEEEKAFFKETGAEDFWARTERVSSYLAAHYERDLAVSQEVARRREEYNRIISDKKAGKKIDENELAQILNFNVYELKWQWDKDHGNPPDPELVPYVRGSGK